MSRREGGKEGGKGGRREEEGDRSNSRGLLMEHVEACTQALGLKYEGVQEESAIAMRKEKEEGGRERARNEKRKRAEEALKPILSSSTRQELEGGRQGSRRRRGRSGKVMGETTGSFSKKC